MDQARLKTLESRCIQEEPPRCRAACPLHVDARALCGHVASGEVDKAWAVLKRHMPLPSVLARICDQPCRAACLRGEAGDPVRVGDLERAVARNPEPLTRTLPVPPRQGRVLVAGAGPSGLTAAWDLAKKGWRVTVVTTAPGPGGPLRDLPPGLLPPEVLDTEIKRLESMGVAFRLESPANPLTSVPEGFDAALVALDDPAQGMASSDAPEPDTLAIGEGLFACGEPVGDPPSWVGLMASGRKAAVSLDRFLQKVSLTAGRDREGPFETRLFTNIEGVEPLPETPMADPAGYSLDEAGAEAARCLDCQCLECVKACPYLAHFQSHPKAYARQIYNNAAIVKGHHTANILINSCMLCGLCTQLCPENFPMAETCLTARRSMVARSKMPPSAFEFALEDMAQACSDICFLARPAPGPDGPDRCDLLFFPGCQLAGSAPDRVEAAYQGLLAADGATGLMLGCCGAPAHWAGQEAMFRDHAAMLRGHWEAMGRPTVIPACPTCLDTLRLALPEAAMESLWEYWARTGLPRGGGRPLPQAAPAVLDPCSARREPGMRQGARAVLKTLGVETLELPRLTGELAFCCGYGGLAHNANPPLADETARQRAAESEADYVTYCAMCRDRLARVGKRVVHVMDLLFASPNESDPAARPDPGFSGRRENRALLRARLLRTIWKEDQAMPDTEAVVLRMSPEVAALLEQRRIMPDDVRRAVAGAESSGRRLTDPATGRRLASFKPRTVTFWVEYSPLEDGFEVFNAWCHRMEIKAVPS